MHYFISCTTYWANEWRPNGDSPTDPVYILVMTSQLIVQFIRDRAIVTQDRKIIYNSLSVDFIHGDMHHWSCWKHLYIRQLTVYHCRSKFGAKLYVFSLFSVQSIIRTRFTRVLYFTAARYGSSLLVSFMNISQILEQLWKKKTKTIVLHGMVARFVFMSAKCIGRIGSNDHGVDIVGKSTQHVENQQLTNSTE